MYNVIKSDINSMCNPLEFRYLYTVLKQQIVMDGNIKYSIETDKLIKNTVMYILTKIDNTCSFLNWRERMEYLREIEKNLKTKSLNIQISSLENFRDKIFFLCGDMDLDTFRSKVDKINDFMLYFDFVITSKKYIMYGDYI